jgi:hypothetical protein
MAGERLSKESGDGNRFRLPTIVNEVLLMKSAIRGRNSAQRAIVRMGGRAGTAFSERGPQLESARAFMGFRKYFAAMRKCA